MKILKKIEFYLLKKLLTRYSKNHLDQWELWKIPTKYGMVFIDITRQEPKNKEAYILLKDGDNHED